MARGWESKDVESQVEQRDRSRHKKPVVAPVVFESVHRRESLMLTRVRVERDLAAAKHPRHKAQLELALAHVDVELGKISAVR